MTHIEIIRKLIGPVRPTGQYERDQDHLKNLKVMSGVLLDLLEDVFEVSKYEGRREASIGAIGKYAADTIGIVNENTGAWDAAEALRKTLQSIRDNCRCVCGDGDGMSFCPHCEAKSALATSKDSK